jgi:hypothetical protein
MVHDTISSRDPEPGTEGPSVEVEGQRFRVHTPRFATQWLPETPSNRHLTLVWRRLLVDAQAKPWFTWQELAVLVGRTNWQAASPHLDDFRECGEDRRGFVLRRRKVDGAVVAGILRELRPTPLAGPAALALRVNAQWGRHDLSAANIAGALEQIACVPVWRVWRRQFETGQVHDQEAALLAAMLESLSLTAPRPAGWGMPSADPGMRLTDPTALAALVPPALPLAHVPHSLSWLTFLLTRFY